MSQHIICQIVSHRFFSHTNLDPQELLTSKMLYDTLDPIMTACASL